MTVPTAVGVDVGGTKILGMLVSGEGSVLDSRRVPTPVGGGEILDAVVGVVLDLAAASAPPKALGIGVPGLVDKDGVIRFSPNLPTAIGLDVAGGIRGRLAGTALCDLACVVDNDANCACAAEHSFGAARGTGEALVVTLGTGIGGGIVSEGEMFRGANNFAGEIGHMSVDPQGEQCACGRRGCWERYASGSALGRLAREAALRGEARRILELAGGNADSVRGEHVVSAALEGDDDARRVLEELAFWLALGLANLANLLDPQLIVLGGGLVEAGDVLLGPAADAFNRLVEGTEFRPAISIVPAVHGEMAGAIGAAALALIQLDRAVRDRAP